LKDLNWVNFYENKSGGFFVLNNQASIGIYFSYLRKIGRCGKEPTPNLNKN